MTIWGGHRPKGQGHLEAGMVIHVLADVVEIVVLAASADALLRVDGALEAVEIARRVHLHAA